MPPVNRSNHTNAFTAKLTDLQPGDYFSIQDGTGKIHYYKALSESRYVDLEAQVEVMQYHLAAVAAGNISILSSRDIPKIRTDLEMRKQSAVQAIVDFETKMGTMRSVPTYNDIYQVGVTLRSDVKDIVTAGLDLTARKSMIPGDITKIPYIAKNHSYTPEFLEQKISTLESNIQRYEKEMSSVPDNRRSASDVQIRQNMQRELNYLRWEQTIYKSMHGEGSFAAHNLSMLAGSDGKLDLSNMKPVDTIINPQVSKRINKFIKIVKDNPAALQELNTKEGKTYGYTLTDPSKKGVQTTHYIVTNPKQFGDLVDTLHMKFDVRAFSPYETNIFGKRIATNTDTFKNSRLKYASDMRMKIIDMVGNMTDHDPHIVGKDWNIKYGNAFKELGISTDQPISQLRKDFKYGFNGRYVKGFNVENLYNVMLRYNMMDPQTIVGTTEASVKGRPWFSEAHEGNLDAVREAQILNFYDDLHAKSQTANPREAISIKERLVSSFEQVGMVVNAINKDPYVKGQADLQNFASRYYKAFDKSSGRYYELKRNIEREATARVATYVGNDVIKNIAYERGGSTAMGLLGAAFLGGGIAYAVEKMRQRDMSHKELLEGMRHDSLMTMPNRYMLTDFGSGLRPTPTSPAWGKIIKEMAKLATRKSTFFRYIFTESVKDGNKVKDTFGKIFENREKITRAALRDLSRSQMFGKFIRPEKVSVYSDRASGLISTIVDTIKSKDKMTSVTNMLGKSSQTIMNFVKKSASNNYVRWGLAFGAGGALALRALTPNYEGGPTREELIEDNEIDGVTSRMQKNTTQFVKDASYSEPNSFNYLNKGVGSAMKSYSTDFGSPRKDTVTLETAEGFEDRVPRATMSDTPKRGDGYNISPMINTATEHNVTITPQTDESSTTAATMMKNTDMYGNLDNKRVDRGGSVEGLSSDSPLSKRNDIESMRAMKDSDVIDPTKVHPPVTDGMEKYDDIKTGAISTANAAVAVARNDQKFAESVQKESLDNFKTKIGAYDVDKKYYDQIEYGKPIEESSRKGVVNVGSLLYPAINDNMVNYNVVPDGTHLHTVDEYSDLSPLRLENPSILLTGQDNSYKSNAKTFGSYRGDRIEQDVGKGYNYMEEVASVSEYANRKKIESPTGNVEPIIRNVIGDENRTSRNLSNFNDIISNERGYPASTIKYFGGKGMPSERYRFKDMFNSEAMMDNFNMFSRGYKGHMKAVVG